MPSCENSKETCVTGPQNMWGKVARGQVTKGLKAKQDFIFDRQVISTTKEKSSLYLKMTVLWKFIPLGFLQNHLCSGISLVPEFGGVIPRRTHISNHLFMLHFHLSEAVYLKEKSEKFCVSTPWMCSHAREVWAVFFSLVGQESVQWKKTLTP